MVESVVYNPHAVYLEQIKNRIALRDHGNRPIAPADKITDLRREPTWLIPELRAWSAVPVQERERKIDQVIHADEATVYTKETKDRCLRYILTQETERKHFIKIVNYLAPAKG